MAAGKTHFREGEGDVSTHDPPHSAYLSYSVERCWEEVFATRNVRLRLIQAAPP